MVFLLIHLIYILILSLFWLNFRKISFRITIFLALAINSIYSIIFIASFKNFDGILFYLNIYEIKQYINLSDFINYIIFLFCNIVIFYISFTFFKKFNIKFLKKIF